MSRKALYLILAAVFINSGLLLAAVPLATDEYSKYYQSSMLKELENPEKLNPSSVSSATKRDQKSVFVLEIPDIGIKTAVVKGTGFSDLMKGPGWYTQSDLPGEGNTAVAGHRTMFGAWFNQLHRLEKGDKIFIYYNGKKFIYTVEEVFKVSPDRIDVIDDLDYPALTLTTCEPIGRATERLVVRARLSEVK